MSKIVCMARNYAAHAKELEHELPTNLVYFLKPPSCLVLDGGEIRIPTDVGRIDVETELAVVIGRRAVEVPVAGALEHVAGYAVFFDITARDLQSTAARRGNPWAASKGYDTFGPISRPAPASRVGNPGDLPIRLKVNGTVRQDAKTSEMLFPVPDQIAGISRVMALEPGDILATGTPAGVWPIHPGDLLEAEIGRVGHLRCTVVARKR